MMRYVAVILSIVTILSLELILFLGAVVRDPESIRPALNALVAVIDLSLVASSGLIGLRFIRHQSKFLGALFLLNIGIFAVAIVLRISGVVFPPWLLFGADLYWLNLYLIGLTRNLGRLFPPES